MIIYVTYNAQEMNIDLMELAADTDFNNPLIFSFSLLNLKFSLVCFNLNFLFLI